MAVVINELEHVADPAASTGDDGNRGASATGNGSSQPSAATVPQVMAAIRRETSRLERLWAD